VIGVGGFFNVTVSGDYGATWVDAGGAGMPGTTAFLSLDMFDKAHGVATVFAAPGTRVRMLTSDGGRTGSGSAPRRRAPGRALLAERSSD
jgi:hypothetical protein